MTVVVTNLTAFTRYFVTITAFTGPLEHAATDGKAIGPIEFGTLEEGMWSLGKYFPAFLKDVQYVHLFGRGLEKKNQTARTAGNNTQHA